MSFSLSYFLSLVVSALPVKLGYFPYLDVFSPSLEAQPAWPLLSRMLFDPEFPLYHASRQAHIIFGKGHPHANDAQPS